MARPTNIAAGWKGNEALYEDFCQHVVSLADSDEFLNFLDFERRFPHFSFPNNMLAYCQKPKSTLIASAHQWQKLGRTVLPHSRPIKIWVPIFPKQTKDSNLSTPTGTPTTNPPTPRRPHFFILGDVFDVSDTTGKEIPTLDHPLDSSPRPELLSRLLSLAKSKGYRPVFKPTLPEGQQGRISFSTKTLTILSTLSPAQQVKIVAHLLAHDALHSSLPATAQHTTDVELEAEAVSYLLCGRIGLDLSNYSLATPALLSSQHGRLSERATRKKLTTLGKTVQQAASSLIKEIEATSLDKSTPAMLSL